MENHTDGAKLWRSKEKRESNVCGLIEGLSDKWSVKDILEECEKYGKVVGLHLRQNHRGGGFQGCGLVQFRFGKDLIGAKWGLKMKDGWRKCYISGSYKEFRIQEMDDVVGCSVSPRISSGSKRHIMHREDNNFSVPRRDTEGYESMHS